MRSIPMVRGALACALVVLAASTAVRADDAQHDRFVDHSRQLTYQGRRAGEAYFSPDGRFLIFQSERVSGNPFYQIYIMSLETGDTHRVSPGIGKTTCSFFQPGTDRVIFASTHLDPQAEQKQRDELARRKAGKERRYGWDYDETFDIFSAGRDGSDLRRLTQAVGYDAEGSYSPDGKKIVFCSMRDAYPPEHLSEKDRERLQVDPSYFGEIYTMDADGSNQTRLTDWPGYDGGPFFTPDGTRIVWRHFNEDGVLADVYTMKTDGSDRRRLTDFGSMCWAPYFHPSGKYVIFTCNKQGFSNFELYLVDALGRKEPVRVTYTDGFDGLPVFSPDGARLAWTSTRASGGRSQVFIADWNQEAALAAVEGAPERGAGGDTTMGQQGAVRVRAREAVAGYDSTATSGVRFSPEITAGEMRAIVYYLASDELEGRMTGSPGAKKAGDYIANYFSSIGIQPLGDNGTYFQSFPFTSGIKVVDPENHLVVTAGEATHEFEVGKDFQPLGFTENGTVEGDVVFAGYGLTTPGKTKNPYDSYAGLDVKDKIVLVLRYAPEDVDMDRRQELNMYAGLRYKAMIARENGAKALLVVTGPNSPNAGELVSVRFDQSAASSGIPVMSITGDVADELFNQAETSLQGAQDGLDNENPHIPGAFLLPHVRVKITTKVEREQGHGRNVIGYIPAAPAAAGGTGGNEAPVLVIGAHYDHLGRGGPGSLADKEHAHDIHNGADDNASGTATVLEIASALHDERIRHPEHFRHGVVVAAWSGEELGTIGSSYFAEHPTIAWDRIAAYMNFDMVGRLRNNSLVLQGIGSAKAWLPMIEKRNVPAGFDLKLQEDPYLPTDVTSFYPHKVPVIEFFTGSHEDYHKPSDDAQKLNYPGMQRIGRFALAIADDIIAGRDTLQWVAVERSKQKMGGRAAMRTYLGTIPDYAGSDVEGVKLSGVRAGGPADKAGLRGGDIIVEFAGKEIKNIYDYTYALEAVKIGAPVPVVVLRDGQRVTLTVVPEARK